jgi:hypothetical protein
VGVWGVDAFQNSQPLGEKLISLIWSSQKPKFGASDHRHAESLKWEDSDEDLDSDRASDEDDDIFFFRRKQTQEQQKNLSEQQPHPSSLPSSQQSIAGSAVVQNRQLVDQLGNFVAIAPPLPTSSGSAVSTVEASMIEPPRDHSNRLVASTHIASTNVKIQPKEDSISSAPLDIQPSKFQSHSHPLKSSTFLSTTHATTSIIENVQISDAVDTNRLTTTPSPRMSEIAQGTENKEIQKDDHPTLSTLLPRSTSASTASLTQPLKGDLQPHVTQRSSVPPVISPQPRKPVAFDKDDDESPHHSEASSSTSTLFGLTNWLWGKQGKKAVDQDSDNLFRELM